MGHNPRIGLEMVMKENVRGDAFVWTYVNGLEAVVNELKRETTLLRLGRLANPLGR